jgi:sucrose phosphorylase
LITETNVPHVDHVSYFGDGHNEAQLVYNFALPPLMLHTLHTGDARALSEWAAGLDRPHRSPRPVRSDVSFFNFLASHDGIGLNPARGILSDAEIAALIDRVVAHGGFISYKHNADGSRSPYELNINYFDALSDPKSDEPLDTQIDRFVVAHAIMLSLSGMPGLYFHSLFGSRGWPEGVALTGQNRTLNRQKFDWADIDRELHDPLSRRSRVLGRLKRLLEIRAASTAFTPHSPQDVLHFQASVMAVLRGSGAEQVLCLHNVSAQPQAIQLDREWAAASDLLTGKGKLATCPTLAPYEMAWLRRTYAGAN